MMSKVVNRVLRFVVMFIGGFLGVVIMSLLEPVLKSGTVPGIPKVTDSQMLVVYAVIGLIFALIFYILTPSIVRRVKKFASYIEFELQKVPTSKIIAGTIGLIVSLSLAYLVSGLFKILPIPFLGPVLTIIAYIVLGYLGISVATKNMGDFGKLPDIVRKMQVSNQESKMEPSVSEAKPKILDTSVIIDGRIADICRAGFIEGTIIVTEFVLEELRHISDSSDSLKRNRGRRGLDILNVIQKELDVEVKIVDTDFEDVSEVDIKLLKLAQKIDGIVLTNDYNLNKVAELQRVPVLNINELANAVKPIVMPGEEMKVQIIKEGKEQKQGIAYLDDGTMIVVEDGRNRIGEEFDVIVTSVLQTAAGRMIFAKSKR
jgi:uncharacterized protein YacL